MGVDGVRVGRLALRKGREFVQISGRLGFELLTLVPSPCPRAEAGTAEQRIEIDWIFDTIAQACSSW
jgi:hypothetical protein